MKEKLLILFFVLFCSVASAQTVREYQVKYPVTVTDMEEKLGFLYRLQELLRLEHNQRGSDYRNGLITKEEWKDYVNNVFEPKQGALSVEIITQKNLMKKRTKYTVSIGGNIEEKNR